uniref:Uncharacterized protein n=1 Tax=Picea glauca TaxID=3330 RepID=A0A101M3Z6_PICGL|nr:hypothetical protein ABT39_MTgene500 [Picea glauca]QHR87949.1 hypothetical protein Q903MT_gene1961 [Picea sitchensis]
MPSLLNTDVLSSEAQPSICYPTFSNACSAKKPANYQTHCYNLANYGTHELLNLLISFD